MHRLHRRPTASIAAVAAFAAAACLVLLAAAVPVLAKEGLEARLDAPIARQTPGGTELVVGVTVTVPDGTVTRAVEGSPIYLKLTAPDRESSWQLGREQGKPGHYVVRIVVPDAGVASVEVGMHGTSDLPITVIGDALVAGGITPRTAQVAPARAAALTPLPRALAPTPVATPATAPAPAPVPWVAILAIAGIALVGPIALGVAAARRGRSAGGITAPRRAPGA